jgi:hypothetical protein
MVQILNLPKIAVTGIISLVYSLHIGVFSFVLTVANRQWYSKAWVLVEYRCVIADTAYRTLCHERYDNSSRTANININKDKIVDKTML